MRLLAILLFVLFSLRVAGAAASEVGLRADPELVESGLMKYVLPRFSLKTSVRVNLDEDGTIKITSAPPGEPVFARDGTIYYLVYGEGAEAERFAAWLTSEIGRRTVESFEPETGEPFTASFDLGEDTGPKVYTGDPVRGEKLALALCGRCHVVSDRNPMAGIGSTPSFAALRTLSDWDLRFESFFARNPHGSFTQVDEVTDEFDPERPPPISSLEITVDDLDAIIAYAAALTPANLGAPVPHQ